jgi:PAS domain S-box-containing protein
MSIFGKNTTTILTLFLALLSDHLKIIAQQVTDDQIKTGYIYNFQKYITWEKESKIDTFYIGVYGGDETLINTLKSTELLLAKNKPIRVKVFNSVGDITFTHILYISYDRNYFVKDIYELIKGRNTMIISDRCEYQRYVMINFVYDQNSKILFEINSRNIEEAGLKTSPKLILLGGNEIDVRKLYIETEKSLLTEKEKSGSYEKELVQKKEEIKGIILKLANLYSEIEVLQNKISVQKLELTDLTARSLEQKRDLEQKSYILNHQQNEISKRENQLKSKDTEILNKQNKIEQYSQVLNTQKSEISSRQQIIDKQGQTLNNQVERIKTQQTFLYLLFAVVIMAITLILVIYRNFKINRKRNRELEKLSIVARETDNAVVIMNEKGEFEWVNEGFVRMFGYTLEQLIHTFGNTLLKASSYESIKDVLDKIYTNKKSVSYESSILTKEGKKIWMQSTLTPILDEDKNIKKLIVIDSNITQLKEAEFNILEKNEEIQRQSEELFEQTEQLMSLNEELVIKKDKLEKALQELKNTQSHLVESEKMVILGQLTAGIAHEINNPINFINSGIDGLKEAYGQFQILLNKYEQLTEKNINDQLKDISKYKAEIDYQNLLMDVGQITKDIKSGINRTIEIIKSLRTFARLDESDLKLIDLHKSIESTLVILKSSYNNRIKIIKDYGEIPELECFPGKINQLLLNILVNAIQSIKNEGTIFITTKLIEKDGQQCVEISVKDSGVGIDKMIMNKIFEPFFTTKEAGEGTGLGLSISKNIAEAHYGTIDVESAIGEGTTFIILLPVEFKKKNKSIIFD